MVDEALREAAGVAGDRWLLLVLAALSEGPRRFGDLSRDLSPSLAGDETSGDGVGIAPNVLIDRLRRMQRQGLIVVALYSRRPRRYVYDLTESGHELAALLPALSAWGARRRGGEPRTHGVCGTALETRLWCPTCRAAVDDNGHDEELRWV